MRWHTKVSQSGCLSPSTSVAVRDTGHCQQLLGDSSSHDTSTSGSRDESHQHTAALACQLIREGGGVHDNHNTADTLLSITVCTF